MVCSLLHIEYIASGLVGLKFALRLDCDVFLVSIMIMNDCWSQPPLWSGWMWAPSWWCLQWWAGGDGHGGKGGSAQCPGARAHRRGGTGARLKKFCWAEKEWAHPLFPHLPQFTVLTVHSRPRHAMGAPTKCPTSATSLFATSQKLFWSIITILKHYPFLLAFTCWASR
jgi:hypothetical protein